MKIKRKIIEIDENLCNGCGECVPSCAEGAIQIVDGKARLVAEKYCDGLGACMGECPQKALTIVERIAEDFDEGAVESHIATMRGKAPPPIPKPAKECGCPSAALQSFIPREMGATGARPGGAPSALSNWPVQIRLIPANAPFLQNAEILVAADCVPVVHPEFHQQLLKGKKIMIGCPKFDDVDSYVEKFVEIFATAQVRGVTVAFIEVPCCRVLPGIIKQAAERAGVAVPITEVVMSRNGEVLGRQGYL